MRRLGLSLILALWASLALAQQPVPISGLPSATLPLAGTEIIPLVQSGTTKQTLSLNFLPAGTSGQVGYNNAGTWGAYTNTQLTALINTFTSTLTGAVPASGGGTTNFLRADATWAAISVPLFTTSTQGSVPGSGGGTAHFLRADATWATPAGGGNVSGPGSSTTNNVATYADSTGTTLLNGPPYGTTGNSTLVETSAGGVINAAVIPATAISAGSCTFCSVTFGADGRATAQSSGSVTTVPTGTVAPFAGIVAGFGNTVPTGWLVANGQAVLRASYATLFGVLNPSTTCTITIATPGVLTIASNGLLAGDMVMLETSGALPTGLAVDTLYYVVSPATNTFELAATSGGTAINTTGSQSGTQTCFRAPYGALTSTTFPLPDLRGRAPFGSDTMATTAASRLGSGNTGGMTTPAVVGATGGQQSHTLTSTEQASMSVSLGVGFTNGSGALAGQVPIDSTQSGPQTSPFTGNATGGGGAHNVLNPALVLNYIIKQ